MVTTVRETSTFHRSQGVRAYPKHQFKPEMGEPIRVEYRWIDSINIVGPVRVFYNEDKPKGLGRELKEVIHQEG